MIVRNWLWTRALRQLEILALRHQLSILQREQNRWPPLTSFDRIFWAWLYRLCPGCLDALAIMKPETVVRWHRKSFRKYWTWTSGVRGPGRPAVSLEIRNLVRRMSQENPLWGAPRIHGELLKLGIEISQASVSKYMVRHPMSPAQTLRTFLRNQVRCWVSVDFFTVPTAACAILFVYMVLRHDRCWIVHISVTARPTTSWAA